ncbi:MAG TPA: hypothetical protein ENL10_02405 [Candidatus Cloacimonetes bacterium]|nr:hypothetical protein [Candidatus Cloacimonadota bacterium]
MQKLRQVLTLAGVSCAPGTKRNMHFTLGLIEIKAHIAFLYNKETIMLTKLTVQKSIESLPSEFSIDELNHCE